MSESATSNLAGDLIERVRAGQLPSPTIRRGIRIEAGLSLRALADELGVDPMSVHRWETGAVRPRLDHAIAYRALLDQLQEVCS